MSWLEKAGSSVGGVTTEREAELEKAKAENLPLIQKEAEGLRPFDPVEFQPVRSPGIYEAEFGMKEEDIIFHFWPAGYHEAQRERKPEPRFMAGFSVALTVTMGELFEDSRLEIQSDKDMGAIFVKARGWGKNQFARELAIKACEGVHSRMGGQPG